MNLIKKNKAFTLTEVLIATAIVGVIAGLVLPVLLSRYQEKALDHAYTRQVNAITDAVSSLAVSENKASFFETSMYKDSEPSDYSDSSGKFMKKYLRAAKDCGNSNGNCFAKNYYQYVEGKKEDYKPEYKGYCAGLKNGVSICMTPQVGRGYVEGIIDLNGKKQPNIFGRDLRTFTIDPKYKTALDKTTGEVYSEEPYLVEPKEPPCTSCDCDIKFCPPEDECARDRNSEACCMLRASSITSGTDACCNYSSIKSANSICTPPSTPPEPVIPPTEPDPPLPNPDDVCTNCSVCANNGAENNMAAMASKAHLRKTNYPSVFCQEESYWHLPTSNLKHYVWDCVSQSWHLLEGVKHIGSDGRIRKEWNSSDTYVLNNDIFQAGVQGYKQGSRKGTFFKNGKWYTYNSSTMKFDEMH